MGGMSELRDKSVAPISIYLVFHPDSVAGRSLTKEVFEWFRTDGGEVMPQKVALPIHYRAHLSDASPPALDVPIDWKGAEKNWIVLFIDEHMLVDERWQAAVAELVKRNSEIDSANDGMELFPVALHSSATNLHPYLATEQMITLPQRGEKDEAEAHEKLLVTRLLRSLTQVFAQKARELLSSKLPLKPPPEQPRIFISHAKVDGRAIADQCRTAIYRYGQIEAFFDEHDLKIGSDWRDGLIHGVCSRSSALLVIETDAYASRPWCRKELELARKPQRLVSDESSPLGRIWRLLPTVVVSNPSELWSKGISELGNVPRIGWKEERLDGVLDRLMLEALLADAHTLYAMKLIERFPDAQVVTRVPDVHSLQLVVKDTPDALLFYPGHGLSSHESEQLRRLLPPAIRLRSFEEETPPVAVADIQRRPLIAVSAGMVSDEDLWHLGYGIEHFHETLVHMARTVLKHDFRLGFGGRVISEKRNDFTESLLDAVRLYSNGLSLDQKPVVHAERPFVSYQRWGRYQEIPKSKQAELLGICQFVFIDLDSRWGSPPQGLAEVGPETFWRARAKSSARREMARGNKARVRPTLWLAFGGKRQAGSGFMPGLAEEYLEARLADVPVVPLAVYGGCAGEIARYVADDTLHYPEVLTPDYRRGHLDLDKLDRAEREEVHHRYEQLRRILDEDRQLLHQPKEIFSGVPNEELRTAMLKGSGTTLLKFLGRIFNTLPREAKLPLP